MLCNFSHSFIVSAISAHRALEGFCPDLRLTPVNQFILLFKLLL